jgi:predicted ribosomally synthesized peptide with SipW-like signal peptide
MLTRTRFGSGRRLHQKLLGSMVVLGLVGLVLGVGTWSAFSATTSNPNNHFAAGTVTLSDNDSGGMFVNLTGLRPGDTYTNCIRVDYTGSLPADEVRMYGTTGGTGLANYVIMTVTRGTAGAWNTCAGWAADATDYGQGAGIVYRDTLANYPDDWDGRLVDTPAGTETWTNPESHFYQFTITVDDNNAAQGLTATQTFIWEARTS